MFVQVAVLTVRSLTEETLVGPLLEVQDVLVAQELLLGHYL